MTAAQKPNRPSTQVVTGVGRGSYVKVFEAERNELSGKLEYSMAFLIPKSDTETISALKRAAKLAADAKWPEGAKRPRNLRNPLRDGDEERPDDVAYAGHYWINVKSQKQRPGIVDANMQPVIDPGAFVSGDYCRISVNAYAYEAKGNTGVAFGLNNIQVVYKGEPLGGSAPPPENDFGVFESGSTLGASDDDLFD